MDLYSAIRELYEEKKKLDLAIAALEAKQNKDWNPGGKRRGRKGMSHQEREEVSQRMRAYWASRRNEAVAGSPDGASGPVLSA